MSNLYVVAISCPYRPEIANGNPLAHRERGPVCVRCANLREVGFVGVRDAGRPVRFTSKSVLPTFYECGGGSFRAPAVVVRLSGHGSASGRRMKLKDLRPDGQSAQVGSDPG